MQRTAALPKITRPKPRRVLTRTRVFHVLDQAQELPVVWVMAPPGAGKTTLVSHYLEKRDRKHLWYQVDAGDNDIADLFHYLSLAARPLTRRVRKPLPRFAPEYLTDIDAFFRLFFRELFARLAAPTTFVFDDYQEIASDAPFHRALCTALEQMPVGNQIIVVSRTEPPPMFARVQAHQQMARIDWQALKLTRDEALEMAQLQRDNQLPGSAQEQGHRLCDGWVTGFMLLFEQSMNPSAVVFDQQVGVPALVFEYFELQVFARAPAALQQLWLSTAYLPKFTKAMALDVSAIDTAATLIDTLARQHLFIQQHGTNDATYQYHALLQAFLRHKVDLIYTQVEREQLLQRSATVLQAHGDHAAAFELFCAAQIWDAATQLVLTQAERLFVQSRWQTLRAWIAALPKAIVTANPWLQYWDGVCYAQTDPMDSLSTLANAYENFVQTGDIIGQALSASAVMASNFERFGHFEQRQRWLHILEQILAQRPLFPGLGAELRVWSALLLAYAYEPGVHALAATGVERVQLLCRSPLPFAERLGGASHLLNYQIQMGSFASMREIVQEFSPLAMANDVSLVQRATWEWSHGMFCHSAGDSHAALQLFRSAQALLVEADLPHMSAVMRFFDVWTLLAVQELEAARHQLDQLAATIHARPADAPLHHFLCAWLACLEGQWHTAVEYLEQSTRITRQFASISPLVNSFSLYALALAECGRRDEAMAAIDQAIKVSVGTTGINRFIALLFRAEMLRRYGQHDELLEALTEAFATGRRGGFPTSILWIPDVMSRLCAAALAAGIETTYVEKMIRKRGLLPPDTRIEIWPWPVRIYTFGRFDIVVYGQRLQSEGKTQRRPQALLKAIIAFGGRKVAAERLSGELWPDMDGDAAHEAFKISLHRLRRLLGSEQAVRVESGEITLNAQHVWVDVWAFERGSSAAVEKRDDSAALNDWENKTQPLYQGAFLGADSNTWAVATRERLRNKYLRTVTLIGTALERRGHWQQAANCYEQGINVEPMAEEIYVRLIGCYQQLQQRGDAQAVYRRCKAALNAQGIEPTRTLQALNQELSNPV